MNQKIDLLNHGSIRLVEHMGSDLSSLLGAVGCATELQYHGQTHPTELSVLRGALGACKQILDTGLYDTLQTTAIVTGLDAAATLNNALKVQNLQRAMQILNIPTPA